MNIFQGPWYLPLLLLLALLFIVGSRLLYILPATTPNPFTGGGKRQKGSNYNLLLVILFSSLLIGKYLINVGTEPNLTLNYSY
jgi:hypothetical protein